MLSPPMLCKCQRQMENTTLDIQLSVQVLFFLSSAEKLLVFPPLYFPVPLSCLSVVLTTTVLVQLRFLCDVIDRWYNYCGSWPSCILGPMY